MNVSPAKRLEGINEYYFSSKLKEIAELNQQGRDIINLGIGSPDLEPHHSVTEELSRLAILPGVNAYQSYKGIPALRQAMSQWYFKKYEVSLNPDSEILPLLGSKEGIMHICMTYLNQGDRVLIPDPGYPTYSSAVKLAGGVPVYYTLRSENNWEPDFYELNKEAEKGVKIMFINYPHTPTGKEASPELFEALLDFARKHGILLVHDNPYSFILTQKPMSFLGRDNAMDYCIELNSLSKSHNMAGWRIGLIAGRSDRISEILSFKSNMDSGMFLPLQLAAIKALDLGNDWFDSLNSIYQDRKKFAENFLEGLGCKIEPRQAGMFIWAHIPGGYDDAYHFSDIILQESRVFITPGGIFGQQGKEYIRLSLCNPASSFSNAAIRCENFITRQFDTRLKNEL